ncbi:tetratricopeptide repeat protein [Paludibacter sp.]
MKKTAIFLLLLVSFSCSSLKRTPKQDSDPPILSDEAKIEFKSNLYEGLRLKEERQFEAALEHFVKCNEINNKDAGIYNEMSIVQLALGKKAEALANMQEAVRLEPDNWWFTTFLINLYVQEKKIDEAVVLAENLLKKYPDKERSYQILIPLYKQTNKISQAINLYDRLERITGVNEKIVFDKIYMYLMANKQKKAFQEIEKLINKYPHNYNYRILKGDILLGQNKTAEALEVYQSIQKDDSQNPYVLISLSEYYKATGNKDKSIEYLILALKNEQLDIETKFDILKEHMKDIIQNDGKIEETEDLIKMLVEQYPLEEEAHGYYAAFLRFMKRDDEAIKAYESMLTINPENPQTWMDYMMIYFAKKDYPEAIKIADKAIEAASDKLTFYFYKGIMYDMSEDYTSAITTFKEAIELFEVGQNIELKSSIYTQLGDVYMKVNEDQNAFSSYDEAILLNPNNLIALNNYAYYLSLKNVDLDKAERMSAKTVEKEPRNSTYLDTYAWIFYQKGNYSLAKFYIERAIDNIKPEEVSGVLYEHYGDILWMSGGNDQKALEIWQKAYEQGIKSDELKSKIDNKGWNR